MQCSECGSSSVVEDRQQGHAVCRDCGNVVDGNFIVSEVQFEESAGGGIRALGSRIGEGGINQVGGINGVSSSHERRVLLLNRAREEIRRIVSSLNLTENHLMQAVNFYDQALNRRLTIGTRWVKSLSACVYIVARLNNLPIMLLDLSDIVQVNVWELGQVYSKITRGLFITIPVQDPSLLIMRFAQHLELGTECQRVMNTAVRICQRMNRDWMHIGRRPAGLCGSALLAACRFHGFNRTFDEFAEMVRMSTSTLKLRMKEFASTPAGQMNIGDFLQTDDKDIPDESLPPISKQHLKAETQSLDERMMDEVRNFQIELEKIIEERQIEVGMRYASYVKNDEVLKQFELTADELDILQEEISSVIVEEGGEVEPSENERQSDYVVPECRPDDNFSDIDDEEIQQHLLGPDEVVRKTKKWVKENLQFLKEARQKRRQRQEEELLAAANGSSAKKKRKSGSGTRQNPRKRLEEVLSRVKASDKINYDILKSLDEPLEISGPKRTRKMVEKDETKLKELHEDLKQISSIAQDIKANMKEMKNEQSVLDEEIDVSDEDEQNDEAPMMGASQMISQEMGYEFDDNDHY